MGILNFFLPKNKKWAWKREEQLCCIVLLDSKERGCHAERQELMPCNWWLVASRGHKWFIASPMLFKTFTDRLDDETECILSKSKGDTKFGRMADMLNVRQSFKPKKLENRIKRNFLCINKENVKGLYLKWMTPCGSTRWEKQEKTWSRGHTKKCTSTCLSLHGKQPGCQVHQ